MTRKALAEYLAIAKQAALSAGEYLLAHKKDISIESQYGKDIKISADRESERLIIDILRDKSGLPILSEERGLIEATARSDDLRWIVDPLDGSLNFLRGIPSCCVSIGLWNGNRPMLGAIYDFERNELFTGIAGTGAWLNGHSIRVSEINAESEAVLLTGFPVNTDYSSQALTDYIDQVRIFKKIRLIGSAALSLAYVAVGRADAYVERNIMLWDIAAGLAILLGAGGKYSVKEANISNAYEVYATNRFLQGILGKYKLTMT
ncbi:inositol monophosphatase [Dehalococcoidia bacterium]|nr:inositol monophosphatase [Dehalococcoidia bacterium]